MRWESKNHPQISQNLHNLWMALEEVSVTGRQLEAVNKRAPVEVAGTRLKLTREDHRATIHRIDTDGAVITPARQVPVLRSTADEDRSLVSNRSDWIRRTTIGVANARHDGGAGDVVTDGDAAGLVHRRAAHPAKIIRRCKRALLEKYGRRGAECLPR